MFLFSFHSLAIRPRPPQADADDPATPQAARMQDDSAAPEGAAPAAEPPQPHRNVAALSLVRMFGLLAALLLALPFAQPARADAFGDAVAALNTSGQSQIDAINALVALEDPRAIAILNAVIEGDLYALKSDGRMVLAVGGTRRDIAIVDALTAEDLGAVRSRDLEKVNANNRLRGILRAAVSRLQIADPDPAVRLAAASALAAERTPENTALLREAIAGEQDPAVHAAMQFTLAQMLLVSPDRADRLAGIASLAGSSNPGVRSQLLALVRANADGSFVEPDEEVRQAAADALAGMERQVMVANAALTLFQGISLGSVLLLAAIGLAITFGVMGVINMAHGEMLMLGAYTTFVVQEAFRAWAPGLVEIYPVVAVPAAFLVAGAFGVAIERSVIRFLYGRPLETLLATWGISLILQQLVRTIFGAPNREVANPSWLTGNVEVLGSIALTYNRIAIILFCFAVFFGVLALYRFTRFGLNMRAVAQNRPMASAMGIRTGWIDALTFGFGCGIAGMGGVALSQIGNVSPNLGQSYIVDSFMAVVFGGVGSLWGVLVSSMTLGLVNKVLEPYSGAVLGKIAVLVLIILFIQVRPRGLFAMRGRAAEA